MSAAEGLVARLRHRADEMASGYVRPQWVSDRELLREAARVIERLEQAALLGEASDAD